MKWFETHRQEWIGEMLAIYGFINREHLQRKFGISTPQASLDLQAFARQHPKAMRYDTSRKCYVRSGASTPANTGPPPRG
jgi:hypothetical protein